MIWWFKGRRVGAVILPSLVGFLVVTSVAHDQSVTLPGLLGTGTSLLFLMNVTPLITTSALNHSLAQRLPEAEHLGVRAVQAYDTVLALLTTGVSALTAWAVGLLADSPPATEAGRNTLFLVGLMLLAGSFGPQVATVAPAAWVFATALVGYRDFRRPWPWAVTLHPAGQLPALLVCLAVFVCGLAALARTRRRTA